MHDQSILKPINEIDAFYLVHAKATYFPSFVSVYIPNIPYKKIHSGLEPTELPPKKSMKTSITPRESNTERSLRLTRKKIKEYALCNQFELFATFTFATNRQDIVNCKNRIYNWFKNQQRRTGKFEYITVPEFHKDGESLHFHTLLKNYQGKVVPSISPKTGQHLKVAGKLKYHLGSYTLGFSDVRYIDNNLESHTKIGFYIQKYITKHMPILYGKNRYYASRGLEKPKTEDNPEKWYLCAEPDRQYEVENGKILEFNAGKNPLVDMFHEARK